MNGPLWAVTTFFNPAGYQRRKANYKVFRDRLRLPLMTIEWSQTGEFALGPEDADQLIQLDGGDVMWQKERLLNIAVSRLPPECTHVAWLDCDLIFEREDLGEAVLAALDTRPLVQLFDCAAHLAETPLATLGGLDFARAPGTYEREGAASAREAAARAGLPPPVLASVQDQDYLGPKPCVGFAWAARRSFLERHPFFDEWIIGGGDSAYFHAAIGMPEHVVQHHFIDGSHRDRFMARAHDMARAVHGGVGHVAGRMFTLWHGNLENRRYRSRHSILARHGFDPRRHLRMSASGVWDWADAPLTLRKEVRAYFEQRNEDGATTSSLPELSMAR
jgi:hypothetical protein